MTENSTVQKTVKANIDPLPRRSKTKAWQACCCVYADSSRRQNKRVRNYVVIYAMQRKTSLFTNNQNAHAQEEASASRYAE